MTLVLPSTARRSRFLFDWSASACLTAPEQSLNAQTSQAATFSRASTKTALDANGAVRIVPHSLPAFQWSLDPVSGLMTPGVLLEDARTNVVLWSRDLTNAAWTKTTCTATKDQTGVDGLANGATSLLATAGNATALQVVTLASSARYQSAYVKRITGSGVVQMTTDNGATWTTITVTSVWTLVTIPTQTLANPTVGFRLVTNADKIAVDFVQNENGLFQTSPIPTTTVAVPRSADALSFAFNDLPRVLTVYAKFANGGRSTNAAGAAGIVDVGGNGVIPRFLLYHYSAGWYADHSGVFSVCNVPLASGDTVECRGVLNADGTAVSGVSVNGAVETTNATSYALTLEAAWNTANLYVNRYDSGSIGYAAFQSVRIAAGSLTMAQMRAA